MSPRNSRRAKQDQAPADAAPLPAEKGQKGQKGDEQTDLIAAGVRAFWRTRAIHGPVSGAGIAYCVGLAAHKASSGGDLAMTLIPAALEVGGVFAHRRARRKAGRPLVRGQWLWELAVVGATSIYIGISSMFNPHSIGMAVVLGALDLPIAVAWWGRSKFLGAQPVADEPAAPAEPDGQDEADDLDEASLDNHPKAAMFRGAWERGMAGTGAKLPGSALIGIRTNPETQGGGMITRVVTDAHGGAVNFTPRHVLAYKELIHQALLRVMPDLHPSNLVIQAKTNGTTLLAVLTHNPLTRPQMAQPSGPGTFTHRVGRTPLGETVSVTLYEAGFGRRHRAVVGSTGSGKSTVMNLLIGLDGHTVTVDGQGLVCPIICDPHGGVSYGPWHGRVRIARTPEQIAGALLLVCSEIKRRLEWMRVNKVDLLIPSPEFPMIPVYLDEVLQARRSCLAAGYPIEPMLEVIANEGRKTLAVLNVGMPAFAEEVLYSTLILDALSGEIFILRSKAASTGLKVNTGNWDDAANPQKIPIRFADGSPTTGLGYYIGDDGLSLDVRFDYCDTSIGDDAVFADGGPISHVPFVNMLPDPDEKGRILDVLVDVAYWAEEFTSRAAAGEAWTLNPIRLDADEPGRGSGLDDPEPCDETDEQADPEAADTDDETGETPADEPDPEDAAPSRTPLMDIVTGLKSDEGGWEQLHAVMSGCGMPLSVDDLHKATGLPKNTISMAFSRRRDKTPPQIIRIQEGRNVWYVLPEYAHVPPLEGVPA